jgi:enoyl-CoA hydratase
MAKLIEITREGRVALIRLNRPEVLNALNGALAAELAAAALELESDRDIGAMVITGSERAFAAGADIAEMAGKTAAEMIETDIFAVWDRFAATRIPKIAAVNGFALGGGCELMMMCDFAIAGEGAKFGQPEVKLGVIAGMGGTQRLTRFVGKSKSMEMHLTGRFMDAAEAERSGLVSRVVPAAKLIPEAIATARKIAEKSQLAVIAAKESVNRAYETTLAEGLLFERRNFQALFATEDQKEGMLAFLEKREPQFRDR